jgi:hypothetical protein
VTLFFSFAQSWLPEPEPGFHPGSVELTRSTEFLHLHAELKQPFVTTRATANQQRLWELGDVLELFVQRIGAQDYREYQIAPNGIMLALHYPNQAAVSAVRNGERQMEEYLCDFPIEGSAIVTPDGWNATLCIPVSDTPLRINCGRYDCSFASAPVVSSTAPLNKRDFHRLEEWLLLE